MTSPIAKNQLTFGQLSIEQDSRKMEKYQLNRFMSPRSRDINQPKDGPHRFCDK